MAVRSLKSPLQGLIPPLVTPLSADDRLDNAGLERLIEHVIAGGVQGLFVLGSTGEGPSLSYRLRREMVEQTCRHVRGRVPVLVGITDTSLAEAAALAGFAADVGATAAVTSAPFYFPVAQADLLGYVRKLVQAIPLPLTLYNMPALTHVVFELPTVRQLLDEPMIAGIKDSSGDLDYFRGLVEIARQRDDWTVLVGPENLLSDAIRCGGQGGVCGGANVWPALFVQIYETAVANRPDEAPTLARLVADANRLGKLYQLDRGPITSPTVIRGLKGALRCLGICDDNVAPPLQSLTDAERRQIAAIVPELGLSSP